MKREDLPKELDVFDFRDVAHKPDGYNIKSVPSASDKNFQKLIEEHNKLVRIVNELAERHFGIVAGERI